MERSELLERIVINPKVMVGKPVIKGTRLTVQYILGLLAHGATMDEILQEYEGLTREDILACMLFAMKSMIGCLSDMPSNLPTISLIRH